MKFVAHIERFFIFCIFLYSCASQSSLGGGPKDETPPKLVKTIPAENSKNIRPSEIEFVFDEFIQLKSLQQKMLISPPFNQPPDVKLKTKGFTLVFKDSLHFNTTYSIYFGDAIVDLNENNPLRDYTYIFSTGNIIDSIHVTGYVWDALTQKPEEQMLVALYADTSDSVPFKINPTYVTRTANDGKFSFTHIKNGTYKLIALQDKNNNYRFDAGTEKIAFYKKNLEIKSNKDSIMLYSFLELRNPQYVKKTTRTLPYKAEIIFNSAFEDSKPTLISSSAGILQTVISSKGDTVTLFFADSTSYLNDTVRAIIKYPKHDSLLRIYFVTQELKLVYTSPSKKAELPKNISYSIPVKKDVSISKDSRLWLNFNEPVILSDSALSLLQLKKDSTFILMPYTLQKDSANALMYFINADLHDSNRYKLIIRAPYIKSNYNHSMAKNDTIIFNTWQSEDYASLVLILELPDSNQSYIFELLNEKGDAVIQRWTQQHSGNIRLERLLPGKYLLKCFIDENKNYKWDSGFYILKKQPEKIKVYPNEIKLRANWDMEINWKIMPGQ